MFLTNRHRVIAYITMKERYPVTNEQSKNIEIGQQKLQVFPKSVRKDWSHNLRDIIKQS